MRGLEVLTISQFEIYAYRISLGIMCITCTHVVGPNFQGKKVKKFFFNSNFYLEFVTHPGNISMKHWTLFFVSA